MHHPLVLVFNKNTKNELGISFIFLKKEKPELVFLVSLVFNKNTKDIHIVFFI